MLIWTAVQSEPAAAQGNDSIVIPEVISVEQAVLIALDRNLLFQRDSLNIAVARSSVRAGFGAFLPRVSLRGDYLKFLNRVSSVSNGIEISDSRPSTEVSGGINATLSIFDGFARSSAYNAAQLREESATLAMVEHQTDVALQTRLSFIEVLKARSTQELRNAELENMRTTLQRLSDRVDAGVALPTDLDAVKTQIATAEYSELVASNAISVAMNRLLITLNLSPNRRIDLRASHLNSSLDSMFMAELAARLGEPEEFRKRAFSRRADLSGLRARYLEARELVTTAKAARYPSVGASVGLNHYSSGPATQTTGTLGIGLTYQLFDGFQTDESVQRAESTMLGAQIDLRTAELTVEADLASAMNVLRNQERLVLSADRLVQIAERGRETARSRYDAGVGSYNDLLTATASFVTARLNLLDASYAWWGAYFSLAAELGYVSLP